MVKHDADYDKKALERDRKYYERTHPTPLTPENLTKEKCESMFGEWRERYDQCAFYGIMDVVQQFDDPSSLRVEVKHPTDVSIFFDIKDIGVMQASKTFRFVTLQDNGIKKIYYIFHDQATLEVTKGDGKARHLDPILRESDKLRIRFDPMTFNEKISREIKDLIERQEKEGVSLPTITPEEDVLSITAEMKLENEEFDQITEDEQQALLKKFPNELSMISRVLHREANDVDRNLKKLVKRQVMTKDEANTIVENLYLQAGFEKGEPYSVTPTVLKTFKKFRDFNVWQQQDWEEEYRKRQEEYQKRQGQ